MILTTSNIAIAIVVATIVALPIPVLLGLWCGRKIEEGRRLELAQLEERMLAEIDKARARP